LGVDKSNWPNIYEYIKPKLDKIKNLQNKFYNSVEAQKVRDIIQNVTTMIDRCINRIERTILKAKLKGKCEYLK
jgi:ribosome-associated translation inhibitor RaiA